MAKSQLRSLYISPDVSELKVRHLNLLNEPSITDGNLYGDGEDPQVMQ